MKPLDIVQLDNGATGLVREGDKNSCSIAWFGKAENKTAWWAEGEKGLKVIDSLPAVLCNGVRHPFSTDKRNPYT
jgi:hypothetical protein